MNTGLVILITEHSGSLSGVDKEGVWGGGVEWDRKVNDRGKGSWTEGRIQRKCTMPSELGEQVQELKGNRN